MSRITTIYLGGSLSVVTYNKQSVRNSNNKTLNGFGWRTIITLTLCKHDVKALDIIYTVYTRDVVKFACNIYSPACMRKRKECVRRHQGGKGARGGEKRQIAKDTKLVAQADSFWYTQTISSPNGDQAGGLTTPTRIFLWSVLPRYVGLSVNRPAWNWLRCDGLPLLSVTSDQFICRRG